MGTRSRQHQGEWARGSAEGWFLAVCFVVALSASILLLRNLEDLDPLFDRIEAEWQAVREEIELISEAFRTALEPPEAPDSPEETPPLVAAVEAGNVAAVLRLIAGGADVNAPDATGRTPLMHAAASGNVVLVRLLLEAGADPALRDDDGRRASDFAREAGHQELAEGLTVR